MKHTTVNPFDEFMQGLPAEESRLLQEFFREFDLHCLMRGSDRKLLRADFEKAILYYLSRNVSLSEALSLLDPQYTGGFYARPAAMWFPLDDAAKIYPLSMEHGRMSVFRLSVCFKSPIVPELMQMALNFTIKRFPSFATTLKKGFFWHYLVTTKRRFCLEPETDIPCQPLKVSESGSQSFRVLYYKNRLSVEFFHVLTDGTGGMQFIKALAAEYLRLTGIPSQLSPLIPDINAIPDAEEFENAFTRIPLSEKSSGFVDKSAAQMNGKLSRNKPSRIVILKMNAGELKTAAEKYHATVTEYLLGLMFLAGKAATDDYQGEASIQVPVNMRKFYPSKTVRNFSMYCGIRIPLARITALPDILDEIKAQLQKKASKELMNEMLTGTVKLVSMLKFIPLVIKQPVARLIYGFLGDKIFTNNISNLGVVRMPPEMEAEIDSMEFLLGTSITNRAACGVVTIGNTASFSITKMTMDPTFEETLAGLLKRDGITLKAEGSEYYEA